MMTYNRAVEHHAANVIGTGLKRARGAFAALLCCGLCCVGAAQDTGGMVAIKAVAEVEQRSIEHGREVSKLAPADRVASGDRLIYTLEVRNIAPTAIPPPTVIYAVPDHTTYEADSAVGPATKVSYSVDGGRSFDVPENLVVEVPGRPSRLATASDYTHIRWQLKRGLKGNSVAFVRFRARMK